MIFHYLTPPAVTSALLMSDKIAICLAFEHCILFIGCSAGQLTEDFVELECVHTWLWALIVQVTRASSPGQLSANQLSANKWHQGVCSNKRQAISLRELQVLRLETWLPASQKKHFTQQLTKE